MAPVHTDSGPCGPGATVRPNPHWPHLRAPPDLAFGRFGSIVGAGTRAHTGQLRYPRQRTIHTGSDGPGSHRFGPVRDRGDRSAQSVLDPSEDTPRPCFWSVRIDIWRRPHPYGAAPKAPSRLIGTRRVRRASCERRTAAQRVFTPLKHPLTQLMSTAVGTAATGLCPAGRSRGENIIHAPDPRPPPPGPSPCNSPRPQTPLRPAALDPRPPSGPQP